MVLKVLIVKVYNMNNKSSTICFPSYTFLIIEFRGRHGRDRMVVGFPTTCASVPITTNVVSSNPVHGEVYSIQHYMIKFVSDLREVGGFHWVLRFPPHIKLTATI
jgi:hypothetical protein